MDVAGARLVDMHSHWGTERGYPLRTEAERAQQRKVWASAPRIVSESEMADDLRAHGVAAILDFGFTKHLPLAEVRDYHDYALAMQADHPDVVLGHWLQIDPATGEAGVAEVDRVARASRGFVGVAISGSASGHAASDPIYDPFYTYCTEAKLPVLVMVGYTGLGAGLRGGRGVKLDLCHPRYVDELAIAFPDLVIVTGRPAWPWQDEMIAILLHKPNVWAELHGWSPKHFTPALKREISRRLRDRIMFGADYPLFTYQRLVDDWKAEGFDDETLAHVFHRNAATLLAQLGR